MSLRLDRAVINNPWSMNRMYTLMLTEKGLYLLYTGSAVRIGMQLKGADRAMQGVVNAVVDRGVKIIEEAEAKITEQNLDELAQLEHSFFVNFADIQEVIYNAEGSFWNGHTPFLLIKTASKKFKLLFKYQEKQTIEDFVTELKKVSGHAAN